MWSNEPREIAQKHLRTFQWRVKQWRLLHGPDNEVFFAQDWVPGRALQLDWTNANELEITIEGQVYDHLLCLTVLPYSNWQWANQPDRGSTAAGCSQADAIYLNSDESQTPRQPAVNFRTVRGAIEVFVLTPIGNRFSSRGNAVRETKGSKSFKA